MFFLSVCVSYVSSWQVRAEVKVYMCLPKLPMEASVGEEGDPSAKHRNPLLWWKEHAGEMPHLSGVARRLLCIPATSVPSERVFSASGHIVTPVRKKLKPEKVNMLTFLHFNLP